ncbi:MAG: hypothetical protein IPJ07_14585 [Acidobacteria bacterium]|nr:hypothetical protein [Acidobacteriota bacterium]
MTLDECLKQILDPLYFANMMVRNGKTDGTVAGATNTTAHTVRAALHHQLAHRIQHCFIDNSGGH